MKKLITLATAFVCVLVASAQDSVAVTAVKFDVASLALMVGETAQINATIQPEDATCTDLNWETTNDKVATVDSRGIVKGILPGKCIIRARSAENKYKFASCTVNVKAGEAKAGTLIINEIQVANLDMFLDPSFNYGGWVEIYNPTDMMISLSKLYISDDPDNLKKYRMPATMGEVPAKGFKNIWFDHNGIWNMGEHNQIPFKLDYEGGTIILSDGTEIITQQTYPQAVARTSYARTTDSGSEWGLTGSPTPEKSNNGSTFATQQIAAPVVDKDAQLFTGTLKVAVNIPEGATLRYTTDGSTPSLSNGKTSTTGTFSVTETTPYRFRLFKDGMLPSQVVTRTYILNDKEFTLPIISVNGSNADLFGDDHGVFTQGNGNGRPGACDYSDRNTKKNWNMDWDRPVNFEYIGDEGDGGEYRMLFNQEVDLSRCGGWSRAWTPYSFKLKAEKYYYGANTMNYAFFPNKPYIKNKTLQIRNGGNDNNCRIKDASMQEIISRSGLYVDCQQWVPVMHFINGEYRGVLNMREPNNKHFAYANYGIDSDEMDQFEMNPDSGYVQMEGTKDAWDELIALSANAADRKTYEKIGTLLDIDEYLNYMAIEFYLGGDDYPQNNVKAFRDRNGGKFHFVLFDLDFAFNKTADSFTYFESRQFYTFNKQMGTLWDGTSIEGNQLVDEEIEFVTLFLNLMQNEEFKKAFADRFCIISGSVFEPNRCKEIITEMATTMETPMSYSHATSSGWGGGGWDWPWGGGGWGPTGDSPWNSANEFIGKLTSTRISTMASAMASFMGIKTARQQAVITSNVEWARLSVNGFDIPTGKMNGYLYGPVILKANPLAGYRFVGWKSTGNSGYASTQDEYQAPTSGSINITAVYEKLSDTEIAEQGCKSVMINEISAANAMYVNDYFKKNDWIELYNTTDSDIDIAGMYVSDNLDKPQKYQVPTDDVALNTVIPAHGYKVLWADKLENTGSEIHTSFKLSAEGGVVMIATDECSDTLTYTQHIGSQSFGRYPDGAQTAFVMNIPTIAKANIASMDDDRLGTPSTPNSISTIALEGGVAIAYIDGVVNAKSEDSAISDLQVFAASGMKVDADVTMRSDNRFATARVGHLVHGVYIARVVTADGGECHIKFVVK